MWGPGEGWGAVSAWQQGGRRARAQCSLCSLTIPSCAEDELLDRMARKPSVCESEVGEVGRETIGGWGTSVRPIPQMRDAYCVVPKGGGIHLPHQALCCLVPPHLCSLAGPLLHAADPGGDLLPSPAPSPAPGHQSECSLRPCRGDSPCAPPCFSPVGASCQTPACPALSCSQKTS